MKDNQINLYGLLERLPTEQLDEMLQAELQQEVVDENAVRVILRVLRGREAEMPVEVDEAAENAWAKYSAQSVAQYPTKKWGWAWRAATVVVVIGAMLLIAPTTANAERIFGLLTRWTDSILEFFDPNDKDTNSVVYEFKTDNPGLQQVYDAVVKLGMTDPVVPMWIPEGFDLVEIEEKRTPKKKSLFASFYNGQGYLIFEIDLYDEIASHTYQKDDTSVELFEHSGIDHQILKNKELWVAIWRRDYIECSITIDCQKDILFKILQSIYDGGI